MGETLGEHADFTVDSARQAAQCDDLGPWVARFLGSPGSDNAALAAKLAERPRWWFGPVELQLDQLHRLAGPPDAPVLCRVDDEFWGDNVDDMEELIEDEGWEPPPVIVTYRDEQLVLEDGNHRVESLRRSGARRTWAVVNFESPAARDNFARLHSP
jgi:hypothetical protein